MNKVIEDLGILPALEPMLRPIPERKLVPPKMPGESKAARRLRRSPVR